MSFTRELENEIKKNKYYDSNYFIKTHCIKPHIFKYSTHKSTADLPASCTMGKIWLIKDNSILEIYSYCGADGYNSHANFINICKKNKFALQNFNTKNEIYSNNSDDTINFIMEFINFGFTLFV